MSVLWLCFFLVQDLSEVHEQVEVTYRQIQVRVQDRKAGPVKQLTADDFVFEVNGRRFHPESFLEIDDTKEQTARAQGNTPEPPAGDTADTADTTDTTDDDPVRPSRHVAILLDPGMSSVKGFQVMQQAAHDLIARYPDDTRFAVYQMHMSLRTLSLFTTDREALARCIDEAVFYADLWTKLESFQKNINLSVAELNTPRFGEKNTGPSAGNNAGVARITSELSGLGGLLRMKEGVKDGYAHKVAGSLAGIGRTMMPLPGDRAVFLLTAGGYTDDANRGALKSVTSMLNWENIPVHALHFRDYDTDALNQMRMSRLTVEDLRTMQQNLISGGFVQTQRTINTLDEDEGNLKTSPRTWAGETGGTFLTAFNPLQVDIKLDALARGAAHYYQLTYQTDRRFDTVHIALSDAHKDAGWELIYGGDRGQYQRPLADSKAEANTDFAASLMYGFPHRDTDIDWTMQQFRLEDGTHVFHVLGHLSGAFPEEGYELGMIALDARGTVLDERKAEIRKPGSDAVMEFYDLLAVREAPTLVRALIREKRSGKSSLEEWPIAPESLAEAGLSSIVLVPPGPHEVFAIHAINRDKIKLGKKKVLREKLDPLIKRGGRVPMTFGPFTHGQAIGLYFHAQLLDGGLGQYDLEAFLHVAERVVPAPVQLAKVDTLAPDGAQLMATLDTSRLEPGTYTLAMRLKDKRTGHTTLMRERSFRLD